MKTVNIGKESLSLHEILEMASKENLILKTPEGQEFILAGTDDFDKEIALIRQHDELMQFLNHRSKTTKTYTLNQVREKLDL